MVDDNWIELMEQENKSKKIRKRNSQGEPIGGVKGLYATKAWKEYKLDHPEAFPATKDEFDRYFGEN